jgi:hypothetical protein
MPVGKYILDGTRPVPEPDPIAWARWFETANRMVAVTQVTREIRVVTVFLGINHSDAPRGAPVLFETRVSGAGGALDRACWRYSTWEEAVQGHAEMCQRCEQALAGAPRPGEGEPLTMAETLQALRERGGSDRDEAIPDDTQLSWTEWTAKVEALLAEWAQRQQAEGGR